MKATVVAALFILSASAVAAQPRLLAQAQTAAPAPVGQPPVVTVPGTPPQAQPDQPSQPAVPVKEVSSPAAPDHYGDQAIWALMVSFLIQFLKNSKWFGWITPESSQRLKTQFGFVMAFLTAAGIHFAIDGNIFGDGASITVSGLSVNAVKDVAWQWASQQGWYRLVVKETLKVPPGQGA